MSEDGGFATRSLHSAEPERRLGQGVAVSPEFSTSFYAHPDGAGFSAETMAEDAPHFYTRWSNPTIDLLERRLANLEGAEAAVCFGSGMGAISATLLSVLSSGQNVVAHRTLYVEASRGCPYKCEYCLSSLDQSVRSFPLAAFLLEMEQLIARGARHPIPRSSAGQCSAASVC